MSSGPRHPYLVSFIAHLHAAGKQRTAVGYAGFLARCEQWMVSERIEPSQATSDDLRRYQYWLVETCRRRDGQPLAASTILTCLTVMKSAYRWLTESGRILMDPAAALVLPKGRTALAVAKEHLSQQEVHALIETAATCAAEAQQGTATWALAARNLALITLALATGRRCRGLISLRVVDLDLERCELRVALEKGKTGRVLPVAAWAVEAVRRYFDGPRSYLLGKDGSSAWLFVSKRDEQLCPRGVAFVLAGLMQETARRNPDLTELPGKRISTHSLRVSFAKLMHDHGCSIRSLNEMMLHRSLSTTAGYTPVSLDDLRSAILPVHPRS
jgi:site-specific recombinase XerD